MTKGAGLSQAESLPSLFEITGNRVCKIDNSIY